jgi:hypothetical protein
MAALSVRIAEEVRRTLAPHLCTSTTADRHIIQSHARASREEVGSWTLRESLEPSSKVFRKLNLSSRTTTRR